MHGVFAEKRTQHSHHNNSLLVHLLCDWGTTVSGKPITANLVLRSIWSGENLVLGTGCLSLTGSLRDLRM